MGRNHNKRKSLMGDDDESVMHRSASGAKSEQSDCVKCTGLPEAPLK